MKAAVLLAFLAVAAFPITNASAEDLPKKSYKKAERVLKILSYVDMDAPIVKDVAYELDERIEDGFLHLTEQEIDALGGIKMQLRYDVRGVSSDNLQMRFYHDDSNFEITGSREDTFLTYKVKF